MKTIKNIGWAIYFRREKRFTTLGLYMKKGKRKGEVRYNLQKRIWKMFS